MSINYYDRKTNTHKCNFCDGGYPTAEALQVHLNKGRCLPASVTKRSRSDARATEAVVDDDDDEPVAALGAPKRRKAAKAPVEPKIVVKKSRKAAALISVRESDVARVTSAGVAAGTW